MPTRHCTPMRTLVAMLLALALLTTLLLPYVDAAETIALSKDVTLVSQTLDGIVLDASAAATATTTVNTLLQRCTVQGAGLTVSGATTSNAAGSTATILRIFDTTVKDATLAFCNYLPTASLVHIVNVTATMEGSMPLFDLQSFYLNAGTGSSMMIQRVRATWGDGGGGSVVQISGPRSFLTMSGQIFSFSEAVVTGASHVLEIISESTDAYGLSVDGGLSAFDLVEFRDARGAFLYSNTKGTTVSSSNNGMIRFSNITMTGGQTFFEAHNGLDSVVRNLGYGNVVFSAISSDGPLFNIPSNLFIIAWGTNVKYTFRHINVKSVMYDDTYTNNVPWGWGSSSTWSSWYFYMGNITLGGTLVDSIDVLEKTYYLYATQLVGAYGEVREVRQGGSWPQPPLRSAAAVNCVGGRDGNASIVGLVPGVNRVECNCDSAYYPPYCTTAVDPLVYYDAYSPSPATCGVANCDSCLFGQTSQCGACAFGYGLTTTLGCEIIPCNVANCNGCTADNVCGSCGDGYSLSPDKTGCYTCNIANCNGCTADDVCGSCGDGYSLSPDKTGCFACNIANCNGCTANGVCGACTDSYVLTTTGTCTKCTVSHCSQCAAPGDGTQCAACSDGFTLSADQSTCYTCGIPNCNGCTGDGVCSSCGDGYKLKGTSECKKNGIGWWVWLIVGIAAAAVVAGIIVLVVCCVRRRRSKAEESSSSVCAGSNNAMRRDQSDATEMQQYGSVTNAGAAPPHRSAPSGAYQWSFDDFTARCSTQGSQVSFANPFEYDYQ